MGRAGVAVGLVGVGLEDIGDHVVVGTHDSFW